MLLCTRLAVSLTLSFSNRYATKFLLKPPTVTTLLDVKPHRKWLTLPSVPPSKAFSRRYCNDNKKSTNDLTNMLVKELENLRAAKAWSQCLGLCAKVFEIDSNNHAAHLYSGICNHELGRYNLAVQHYDHVLLKAPSAAVLQMKAKTLWAKNDAIGANHCVDMALNINDRFVPALQLKAVIMEKQNNLEEALFYYRKVALVDPFPHEHPYKAGNILLKQHKLDEAIEWFDNSLQIWKQYLPAVLGKAKALHRLNHHRLAVVTLDEYLLNNPNSIDALTLKAQFLTSNGKYEEATKVLAKVQELNPKSEEALQTKAELLTKTGKFQDALAILDSLVASSSEPLTLMKAKLNLLRKSGASPKEIATLSQSIQSMGQEQIDKLLKDAYTSLEQQQYAQAYELFTQASEWKADDAELTTGMGIALTHLGRIDEARQALEEALRFENYPAEAHFYLGKIHQHGGEWKEACDAYLKCFELDPSNLDAAYAAGIAFHRLGNRESAIEMLDAVLKKEKNHKAALNAKLEIQTQYLRKR